MGDEAYMADKFDVLVYGATSFVG
ncbi:MAG: hypothetical protein RL580_395, partial [Pseudomonadota bacterium]